MNLAEGNTIGLYGESSPQIVLANKAFKILDSQFSNSSYHTAMLYGSSVLETILHFSRPAAGVQRWKGLQNIAFCEETKKVRSCVEDICLLIVRGLDETQKKCGNPTTVKLIGESKPKAIKILHGLGKLEKLTPRKSTDWSKFDTEVMATLKKLAMKDCVDEASRLRGEEKLKFARYIGSVAANLYLAAQSNEDYSKS
jgi:hypothetical protein